MDVLLLGAPSDAHCIKWANALQKRDVNVTIVYVPNHIPRREEINKRVGLIQLPYKAPMGYYSNLFHLKKIIKKLNPDIVNVHYASGYGTLGRLSLKGVKNILSVYGSDIYDFPYKNKFTNYVIKKNLNFYDTIASTSHCMAKQINKIEDNISLKDIKITPFGVDNQFFKFYLKNEILSKKSKIVIGSVKKLESKYGIDYAIIAMDYLVNERKYNNIHYHIYGEGSQKLYLEKLVKRYGLSSNIHFFSRIPNRQVPTVLKEFDLLVAPSTLDSESFGVSVVEAMAVGVPVIASDVEGFCEVLDDGRCGMIVPRKDPVALGKAVELLIKNDSKVKEYISLARKKVEENYLLDDNVSEMIDIYQKKFGE